MYRAGNIDAALDHIAALSKSSAFAREKQAWINTATRRKDVRNLEGALMLQTEALFVAWNQADQFRATVSPALLQDAKRLHHAVEAVAPKSPFIRGWYLLIESFYQGKSCLSVPMLSVYLHRALESFPGDAELLLAAGSRYELMWWFAADNPQRHPSGRAGLFVDQLHRARTFLRQSVASRVVIDEALLRLARVLAALGDLDEAATHLKRYLSVVSDGSARYMGHLVLGDLHERRGDRRSAAAAYQAAIAGVPVAQSARLAAAYLAHAEGNRAESAQEVVRAMSEPLTNADPWWWYVRGRWWRFERDLKGMRAQVQ